MSNAPITDAEIQEIKLRMQYGGMTALAFPYLETALLFEDVIQNNLNDYTIGWIRNTALPALRAAEAKLSGDTTPGLLSRTKFLRIDGEITYDTREQKRLIANYRYWLRQLAFAIRTAIAGEPGGGGGTRVELC